MATESLYSRWLKPHPSVQGPGCRPECPEHEVFKGARVLGLSREPNRVLAGGRKVDEKGVGPQVQGGVPSLCCRVSEHPFHGGRVLGVLPVLAGCPLPEVPPLLRLFQCSFFPGVGAVLR